MAWLDPDRMIAALERDVEALPHNDDALPLSERAAKLAELQDEIALLEAREESLIERAAKDGVQIERRPEQSPSSILGVRIAKPAAARAA
jgi:hypothetical protein